MAVNFKNSETKDNLMRAFAGESQARNRYTFAAEKAKQAKLQVIEAVFTYTADQEKAHAEIFYNHLEEMSGETIVIEAGYPVDSSNDLLTLLRAAQHNEYEEHEEVYEKFANKAKEEGFLAVEGSFRRIAQIEKIHGDRFKRFADWMESNQLFVSQVKTGWLCLHCGYCYEGECAPEQCPTCHHDKGFYVRFTLSPYEDGCQEEK